MPSPKLIYKAIGMPSEPPSVPQQQSNSSPSRRVASVSRRGRGFRGRPASPPPSVPTMTGGSNNMSILTSPTVTASNQSPPSAATTTPNALLASFHPGTATKEDSEAPKSQPRLSQAIGTTEASPKVALKESECADADKSNDIGHSPTPEAAPKDIIGTETAAETAAETVSETCSNSNRNGAAVSAVIDPSKAKESTAEQKSKESVGGGTSRKSGEGQRVLSPPPPPSRSDPHEERTPKHNHLSQAEHKARRSLQQEQQQQKSSRRSSQQQATHARSSSPMRGPSSAAAAAAAAAKALRTDNGITRHPGGGSSRSSRNTGRQGPSPPYDAYYGNGFYPFDEHAAAAYYYGHGSSGGDYYDHSTAGRKQGAGKTKWPDEKSTDARGGEAGGTEPPSSAEAAAAAAYYEHQRRAYLYHQQQRYHAYYGEYPGGYRAPRHPGEDGHHSAVASGPSSRVEGDYDYDNEHRMHYYGGGYYPGWPEEEGSRKKKQHSSTTRARATKKAQSQHTSKKKNVAEGANDVPSESSERKKSFASTGPSPTRHVRTASPSSSDPTSNTSSNGKIVMGGPSIVHVAPGMSTSPAATTNDNGDTNATVGRRVTPHGHNTRHASRSRHPQIQASSSTSSIFRGRPGESTAGGIANEYDNDDENSPQRILLSLSKDAHSFEDKEPILGGTKGSKVQVLGGDGRFDADSKVGVPGSVGGKEKDSSKKNGTKKSSEMVVGYPQSPEGPPRIQLSHSNKKSNDPLFFDPMKSPTKSPGGRLNVLDVNGQMIENAPSFALFNTSFDSLGDSKLAVSMSGGLGISPSFSFGLAVSGAKGRDDHMGPYPEPNNSLRLSGSGSIGGFEPASSFGERPGACLEDRTMVLSANSNSHSGPVTVESGGAAVVPSRTSSDNGRGSAGGTRTGRSRTADVGRDADPLSSGTDIGSKSRRFGTDTSPSDRIVGPGTSISSAKEFDDVLRSHEGAFEDCAFLLPGLKEALAAKSDVGCKVTPDAAVSSPSPAAPSLSPSSPAIGSSPTAESASPVGVAGGDAIKSSQTLTCTPSPTPSTNSQRKSGSCETLDQEIACRRVRSAICAFGGSGYAVEATVNQDSTGPTGVQKSDPKSIFRQKGHDRVGDMISFDDIPMRSKAKMDYDDRLTDRFYEHQDRLSWELEDEPPIDNSISSESKKRSHPTNDKGLMHQSGCDGKRTKVSLPANNVVPTMAHPHSIAHPLHHTHPGAPHHPQTHSESTPNVDASYSGVPPGTPQTKMKYRCKLCGQPKQNHTCPYRQSLLRTIGTMSYKAVNAFTAREPGYLAPSLCTMNNFVFPASGDKSVASVGSSAASTPSRGPRSTTTGPMSADRKLAHITPQSIRGNPSSPGESSLSTAGSPPRRAKGKPPTRSSTPRASGGRRPGPGFSGSKGPPYYRRMRFPSIGTSGSSSSGESHNLLFVEPVDLHPEQFRTVHAVRSEKSGTKEVDAPYQYPALPLPYGQRKRLSDRLFVLSKEVPGLTDECARVLRIARENNMWDKAVADLLVQVVTVLHCPPRDLGLEGLRRHLLVHYGIAC